MSYREENDSVILSMGRHDYDMLLRSLRALAVLVANQPGPLETFDAVCDLADRLNSGNPDYILPSPFCV